MSVPAELTQELERLGSRFGPAVVREEAKRLAKGKRGNKPKSDLVRLLATFEADALDVLEGRDPTQIRTNYSIAREFADQFPDQSVESESIVKRIERKLRKDRLKFAGRGAFWIAERRYPFPFCIEIYENYKKYGSISEEYMKFLDDDLNRYRNFFGEPPKEMTFGEIRAILSKSVPKQSSNFLQMLAR